MHIPPPLDLVIGLDRSDRKADLHLINTHTLERKNSVIDTSPEALWEWLLQLRQQTSPGQGRSLPGTTRGPSHQLPGSL